MRIVIIGAGDIGFHLGKRLSREKHDITMIEVDPARVKRASEQLDAIVVEGHGTSFDVLKRARVEEKEILAAMTNSDEVNLFACRLAKKMGVPTTIARVRNPELTADDYFLSHEELGVDHIIHPEKETADTVVRLIRQSGATHVIDFEEGKVQVIGVRLEYGSPLLRKPLIELAKEYNNPPMRVVAINRNQRTLIPGGNDSLVPGDQIFVVCDPDYLPTFTVLTGKKDIPVEDMMILGGGLIGQFVAKSLAKEVNVKIVESNVERSQEIADVLPDTLIIQGDGTDIDLMALEGLMDMDAFVAVTGDDETNIISTLLARHLKVARTIALVNKTEYLPITPTIGMDAVVSKQLLTANAVHRFIQHQRVAALATVPGVDAEIIEYIAKKGKMTQKPLKKIQFPSHAIIGAVLHDDKMIVPMGDTRIQPGDRVVVFALSNALGAVEALFK